MTFCTEALTLSPIHDTPKRLTLNRFPTISSGAGAKAPFIYVNYHQLSPPRKVKMEDEAHEWISSFET
jgi:hypothetical protein